MRLKIFLVFLCAFTPFCLFAESEDQACFGHRCIQIGVNEGVININDSAVQISVNNGVINFVSTPEVAKRYSVQIRNIERKVRESLSRIGNIESRKLNDEEKIENSLKYIEGLGLIINSLSARIAASPPSDLDGEILKARWEFDVDRLKELLKEKGDLFSEGLFEVSVELARLHELDFEYSEAFNKYEIAAKLSPEDTEVLNKSGVMALYLEEYSVAEKYLSLALHYTLEDPNDSKKNLSRRYNNLGLVFRGQEKYEQAINYFNKSIEVDLVNDEYQYRGLSISRSNLADVFRLVGLLEVSLDLHLIAVSEIKQAHPNGHLEVAARIGNLAHTYTSMMEYEKSIKYLLEAESIMEKIAKVKSPTGALIMLELGSNYYFMAQYKKSLLYLERSLEISKAIYTGKDVITSKALVYIGDTKLMMNEFEDAIAYSRKSIEHNPLRNTFNRYDLTSSYRILVIANVNQEKEEEAVIFFGKYIDSIQPSDPQYPTRIQVASQLAYLLLIVEDSQKLVSIIERELEYYLTNESKINYDERIIALCYYYIGMAYSELNQMNSADANLSDALDYATKRGDLSVLANGDIIEAIEQAIADIVEEG